MSSVKNSNNIGTDNDLNMLDQDSVFRYSRQLIMPEIGVTGQQRLMNSSVLIVGAGGLGCPVIQYLTAAGVGKIGIVDYDNVDLSNLHRQVLHSEETVVQKVCKATSAVEAARKLNSRTKFIEFKTQLGKDNAFEIVKPFDVIVDATDNVPSRYLVSDMCVLSNKPLVSGSALRWEGQLTVYHYKSTDENEYGPCYRCLYCNPPPPETVTNCSDGGVIGVVPGIIGCIQALETIKIIIGQEPSYHKNLLIFDGLKCSFRSIKLRGRQPSCLACGASPSITLENIPDYEQFCQMAATDKCKTLQLLSKDQRLTVLDYKSKYIDNNIPHVLLDVRQPVELEICHLPNAINIPIKILEHLEALYNKNKNKDLGKMPLSESNLQVLNAELLKLQSFSSSVSVVVVCKQGNDSQKAVKILKDCIEFNNEVNVCDLIGGLMSWSHHVDPTLLRY